MIAISHVIKVLPVTDFHCEADYVNNYFTMRQMYHLHDSVGCRLLHLGSHNATTFHFSLVCSPIYTNNAFGKLTGKPENNLASSHSNSFIIFRCHRYRWQRPSAIELVFQPLHARQRPVSVVTLT
jgi:hypothetical protein